MNFLYIAALVLCLAYIAIQAVYLTMFRKIKVRTPEADEPLPQISVLVAARNEASNIVDCLKALHEQDYDIDKIEILIGNDQSTDYTEMLASDFIRDKSQFKLVNLKGTEYPQTKGKARVLAVLASQAKGEYFLITDADIVVPPGWAKAMVGMLRQEKAGMGGGTTSISADSLFQKFQQADWLYFMGVMQTFSSAGNPLTIIGNNMIVSADAYKSTGGYEQIPFSITEDYALFDAVRKKGYKVVQSLNISTLVYSKPLDTFRAVLKQRKRWMTGGWKLPLYYHILIVIYGSWFFALPVLFIFNWKLALLLFMVKDFLQLYQLLLINRKLNLSVENPLAILFYEFYLMLMLPLSVIYFLLPTKNTWKGRKY